MSETLRDLVVSLSLNSDNFTRNIKSINKQIQEAESAFRLASAGVENFETTTAGLSSKLSTLQRTFQLQQDAVGQYEQPVGRKIALLVDDVEQLLLLEEYAARAHVGVVARAAAADPAVLLLDEITANLDAETEARVLEALHRASKGRTVLSISHRLYENLGGRTVEIKAGDR